MRCILSGKLALGGFYNTGSPYLLIALAQALNVSTDALLGVRQTRRLACVSKRLERRIKQADRMPAKPKQQLLGIIDTFIATHQ